jgi:hypothetical protein
MRLFFLGIQSILFIGGFTTAYAQNSISLPLQEAERQSFYYHRQTAHVTPDQLYTVQPAFACTSLSLRIPREATFEESFVVVRQDTVFLQADEHPPSEVSYQVSNLLVFDQPVDQFKFYSATLRGEISFSFINASGEKKSDSPALRTNRSHRAAAACKEPEFVPQQKWRAGLPAPTYTRRATSVEHLIVHHSATFNTLTNYENVVRNIYLFHTQENKWSDIGYNYLIAQDGTIFEGRSSGSQSVDNDNVQGAHFCGQNGGTMGICLLGNYNTAEPTDTAVASLERLAAWKVDKEGLDPLGERTHPANASLETIAGHRNGCATECPGNNLYARLPAIRTSVAIRVATGCETGAEVADSLVIFPIPAEDELSVRLPDSVSIDWVRMYDLAGKQWEYPLPPEGDQNFTIDTRPLATGFYVLHLGGVDFEVHRKILVR